MGILWMERRRGAPLVWPHQRHRRLVGKEAQSAEQGASDGEAGGARRPGDAVLIQARRERPGSVRRQRVDAHRRGADRAQILPHGTRSPLLRCDRPAVRELHREEGGADSPWRLRGYIGTSCFQISTGTWPTVGGWAGPVPPWGGGHR